MTNLPPLRSRCAVATVFFANGVVIASWVPHVPAVKMRHGLGDGELGAAVGLGIANIIPLLFSAATRARGVPAGTALAAVATTGYLGFLAGPPLIGLAAEIVGLPAALGIVSGCCGLVALGAGVSGPPEAPA